MGSLTSRPDIPPPPPPFVVTLPPAPIPAPVATPVQATGGSANETAQGGESTNTEEAQRLAREDNLLRRSRGQIGTILTGFNGVLSDAIAPVRKTLLGE